MECISGRRNGARFRHAGRPSEHSSEPHREPRWGECVHEIRSFVRYPTEWRRYVSNALEIAEIAAKTVIRKTFYGGDTFPVSPKREIPELYLLAAEVRVAARGDLQLPSFTYIDGNPAISGRNRNPTFPRISYSIGAVEDKDLWKAKDISGKRGRRVLANIRDGLIVEIPRFQADQIAGDLSSVEPETCYKLAMEKDYYRSHKSASGRPDTVWGSAPVRGGRALSHHLVLGRSHCVWNAIRSTEGKPICDAAGASAWNKVGPFRLSDAQVLRLGFGIVSREIGASDLADRCACAAYFQPVESGHLVGCVAEGSSGRIYDDSRVADISISLRRFRSLCDDAPERISLMGRAKHTVEDTELYEDFLGGGGGRVRYSTLARCVSGCGGRLVPDAKRLAQPARVWSGHRWRVVKRGRKKRRRRRTSYRPNRRWVGGKIGCAGEKQIEESAPISPTSNFGVTWLA